MANGWARNQKAAALSGESTSRPLSGGAGSMRWDGWLRFSKSSCWVCRVGWDVLQSLSGWSFVFDATSHTEALDSPGLCE
jgi:hypothetical protein